MREERDAILFTRGDQPPGTITLFVMGRDNPREKWRGERRDIKTGSPEHLRYAVKSGVRTDDLEKAARKLRKRK